jgi:hypothetical protein
MMKNIPIRSFHASRRSNLFETVDERCNLPWMSDLPTFAPFMMRAV